jgi:hypothetical protein
LQSHLLPAAWNLMQVHASRADTILLQPLLPLVLLLL